MRKLPFTEKEVGDEVNQFLLRKFRDGNIEDRRTKYGPDFIVTTQDGKRLLVDCKRSQPPTRAGNTVPDRAVGQMIRYHRRTRLPVFLVVPADWRNEREQGEGSGDSWKKQVEDSLQFVKLNENIRVVCLDEMEGSFV